MQNRDIGQPLRAGAEVEVTQRVMGSEWDAVDQASLESFPASDPPARGSFRASPSAHSVQQSHDAQTAQTALDEFPDEEVTDPFDDAPLLKAPPLYKILLAVAALGAMLAWVRSLRRRAHAL